MISSAIALGKLLACEWPVPGLPLHHLNARD